MPNTDRHFRRGKEKAFDAFCKKVIRNEARDHFAHLKRQRQHEVMLSEMSAKDAATLSVEDQYFIASATFDLLGDIVEIADPDLAAGLEQLSQQRRNIILLSYCLDYSDQRIADTLGLLRGTVQYQRTQALLQLKKWFSEPAEAEVDA